MGAGQIVDAAVTLKPWEPIEIRAGYGLFLFGDKAKAIDEMKNGGYQFFPGYVDIVETLNALDAPALRADLKLPTPP